MTWQYACEAAIQKIKEFEGLDFIENENDNNTHNWVTSRTVMKWFREFRNNGESFINSPHRTSLIDKSPTIFQINPDLKQRFISHAKSNIRGLTAEVMHNFFMIPLYLN